jgi:hypothetical protein
MLRQSCREGTDIPFGLHGKKSQRRTKTAAKYVKDEE